MPYRHKLQASRFELKFIIDRQCAAAVRDFVRTYLVPDEHARRSAENSYPVNSLYLDSADLILFRQAAVGMKNRFKLRIRFYDDRPESPAFLEIKRRITDVIRKERAAISRDGVRRLLAGRRPDASHVVRGNDEEKSGIALQNFCSLYDSIRGQARIYVSYVREAYVLPNSDQVRVTFDRELLGARFHEDTFLLPPSHGTRPNVGGVILELKFTDRFPPWMQELVQAFDLRRRSVPKYNMCIEAMGLQPSNRMG
ncbi:MAG TPA: polyphosphate polymerase domain-containing protein [Thermoguttaceae bacterium]|nr:polyphosphate polymerase domain-containing protein [Thermoguttaceae bacterium]